jgi:dipeptide transport system substrate-binding protein
MGMPKLLKSVEKLDDYTIKITLNQPEAPFLADLAMAYAAIQSKEYADAMMKAGTPEKIDQDPIGTGPFYLVQYQKDAVIRYKAFPEFWGGKAKIDDLVYSITPDASVRWAKLQKGECDVMPYPTPADLDAIRKDPNVTVLEQPGLNVGYLAFQTQKKPFDDVRVRKAISMAIDKKAIIDAVYLSTGIAAKNPIPPTMWSYNDEVKDDPYDPEAAKKLLADAGYPNGLETDLWAMPVQRPYNPNAKRIAELMQADLAKIGVKAEIKSFEWGEYRKRMQAGEHQMGMLGWTGDNGDPDNFICFFFCAPNVPRQAWYNNPPLADVLKRAQTLSNQGERKKLYQQAEQMLHDDVARLFVAHSQVPLVFSKKVKGYVPNPTSTEFFQTVELSQ